MLYSVRAGLAAAGLPTPVKPGSSDAGGPGAEAGASGTAAAATPTKAGYVVSNEWLSLSLSRYLALSGRSVRRPFLREDQLVWGAFQTG